MPTDVAFKFDDQSLAMLRRQQKLRGDKTMAVTLRDNIELAKTLQDLTLEGFTEILPRNDEIGMERQVIVPSLERLSPHRGIMARARIAFNRFLDAVADP